MSNRLKRFVSLALAFVIVFGLIRVTPVSADSVFADEVNLYELYSYDEPYLSIPSDRMREYQVDINSLGFSSSGTPAYHVLTSDEAASLLGYDPGKDYYYRNIHVSDSGLVTGKIYLYLKDGSWWYSPVEGYTETRTYPGFGDAILRVTVGNESRYIFFHILDYGKVYFEETLNNFLADKNPKNAYEAADLGASYASSFEYKGGSSTARDMIIMNGGDCWASADMVKVIAERYGYNAWKRNGRKDAGAAIMHANAMVEDLANGIWYEVDAGYSGTVLPRYYYVKERTSLYSYRMNADNTTIEVYQYDVSYMRDSVKSLSFPESIDGKTVTSIGKRFMDDADYDCVGIESIEIPVSITNIAESAFSSDLCKELKYVYYQGTEAEWNAVTIGSDNGAITNATVYFNGEQPTPTVTNTPTPEPTVTDTPTPTVTDTPTPTVTDTPTPTVTDTPTPTVTDTPEPTVTDVPEPTVTDTPTPTLTETHAQVRANSLLLKDKIGVKFLTYLPDEFIADEGARAEINGHVCEIGAKDDRGRYPIVYTVAAAQMKDELVLKLYRGDGTEYPLLDRDGVDVTGKGCSYSVQTYINEASASGSGLDTDKDLITLLYRLEDFGSVAQLYFGYNQSALSFSPLVSDIQGVYTSVLEEYKAAINQASDAGITRTGSSLSLKTATQINHKFELDADKSIEDYKFYVDGNLVTTKSTGNVVLRYEASSGKYVLSIKGIVAAKLHEGHSVVVTDNEDNVVISIDNYSALSYAYAVLYKYVNDNSDHAISNNLAYLMQYMYLYNRAAVKYFGG